MHVQRQSSSPYVSTVLQFPLTGFWWLLAPAGWGRCLPTFPVPLDEHIGLLHVKVRRQTEKYKGRKISNRGEKAANTFEDNVSLFIPKYLQSIELQYFTSWSIMQWQWKRCEGLLGGYKLAMMLWWLLLRIYHFLDNLLQNTVGSESIIHNMAIGKKLDRWLHFIWIPHSIICQGNER